VPTSTQDIPLSAQVLKSFQLAKDAKSKLDPTWGRSLAKYICTTTFSGIGNGYFWLRNSRFKDNRDMAAGKMNAAKFQDLMHMNSKVNYININWQAIKIINTIISKMVGRWMGRDEKIVVKATDSTSIKDKEEEYNKARFVMENYQQLKQLQESSGVQMVPKNQFVPSDQEELDLWMEEYNRLPEEILYEKAENDIYEKAGFYSVIKEKILHDSAETGLVIHRIWMDENGYIIPEWVKPENFFYSYTEYPDFRDCTWMGHVIGMKITEIRKKFGVEFGGTLTEEQLFQIAQSSKEYQRYDKLRWLVEWNVTILRPYDEWNVDVVRAEIKSLDSDPYTFVQTKKNKSTLVIKGLPKKPDDNEEYVEDKRENIYEFYYIQEPEFLLSWGLMKNMPRPQGRDSWKAYFSYAPYMYQMQDMKNVAVPEKIQRPAEEMILSLYKIQQIIATSVPPGAAINATALREIDYGVGDKNKIIDPVQLRQQTGLIYYNGIDAEGNPVPVPITELTNSGFLPQLQAYIQNYEFHYKVLKDELGEDPSLVTSATKPRVAEGNIQTALQSGDDATDYMYDAFLYSLEQGGRVMSCLLHDSVDFGAQAYRHLMNEQDIKGRAFEVNSQMLPTDADVQRFEALLAQAIQGNPDFSVYCDSFKLLRIAREDTKLAGIYYNQCMKKMILSKQQQASQNAQENAQAQQASLQQKGQFDLQLEQMRGQMKQQSEAELSRGKKEEIALQGLFAIWQAGVPMPPALSGVENELVKNILLPLFAQNQINQASIAAAHQNLQDAQQMQQQGAQQLPPPGGQPTQSPQSQLPQTQNAA
jgi:hypothetical protein